MVYEAEMSGIARRAQSRWGPLREVIFIEANKNSLLVFAQGVIRADQLPETDMLAFGYSGTGSHCYATFLSELGFRHTNVENVDAPAKLTKDGTWIYGKKHRAQWNAEVTGVTPDEARRSIPQPPPHAFILSEKVLCDGSVTTETINVDATSDEAAVSSAKYKIESPSPFSRNPIDLVKASVQKTHETTETKTIEHYSKDLALEEAKKQCYGGRSLVTITCLRKPGKRYDTLPNWLLDNLPRKMLLRLQFGRIGRYQATYRLTQMEVVIQYRRLARLEVHYGPKKLICNQCGQVMTTTTEGVNYASGSPSPEAAILKLRCDTCDITRFEKRWEVDGHWIEWEDNSAPTII